MFGSKLPGSTRKVGPRKSTALDQTGHGAIQMVPWGALNRALPPPYSPGSALSAETHFFGPWVCQSILGTQRVHCTGPPPTNLARIPPKLPPGVAGSKGGPIPHRFSNWFHRYCAPSPRTLVIKVCQRLLQVYTVLQMGLQTEPGAIGDFFIPKEPPFGTKGTH